MTLTQRCFGCGRDVSSRKDYLLRQSKIDFINEIPTEEVAEWVMYNHLDLFCRETGYEEWRKKKRKEFNETVANDV
jgi:hypothetical protein